MVCAGSVDCSPAEWLTSAVYREHIASQMCGHETAQAVGQDRWAITVATCQCGSEVVHARRRLLGCTAYDVIGLTRACTGMVAVTSVPWLLDTASPPPVADVGGSSGTAAVALLLQAAPQAWGCCSSWAAGRTAHSRPAQLLLPVLQHS